jgi:predicted nucleic acid-binding protein
MPGKVAAWIAAREARFHISAITLAEINEGIASLLRQGAERRALRLRKWLADVIERYDYRIESVDIGVALTAGELADRATAEGVHPGLADIFIAATAKARDMTVVTRNLKHFIPLKVPCVDPFEPEGG